MAPVESEASARSNTIPYIVFSAHVTLVIVLTLNVLDTARRAANSLPPATKTRTQQPLRRAYAFVFSVLAFLSLGSVATFSIIWRAVEYIQWAERGNRDFPNSLWRGWYANDVAHWHLRDWAADVDLVKEWSLVSVATPEGFLYTSQQYVGLLASAIFMGIEGHRRNLGATTIASFVLLSATGSLGYSLGLFFVTILYTPLTFHNDDAPVHDTQFAPSPTVYYLPILASLLSMNWLPDFLAAKADIRVLRMTVTFAVPVFLAFAPRVVPVRLGRLHRSKADAHRSYARVYHFLAIASFLLYWRLFAETVLSNKPGTHQHYWDVFANTVGLGHERAKTNAVLSGLITTVHRLKQISRHPAISATSLDVFFTTTSLLAWTFTRNLDVEAMLASSILASFVPKHSKGVAFKDDVKRLAGLQSGPEAQVEPVTPRKRGRPAKNKTAINVASATSSNNSLRRSTRRSRRSNDHDSDAESAADSTYQPPEATRRDVAETEADGAAASDLVHGGEATALALFLTFVGGLGQVASGALGAEVTGPQE